MTWQEVHFEEEKKDFEIACTSDVMKVPNRGGLMSDNNLLLKGVASHYTPIIHIVRKYWFKDSLFRYRVHRNGLGAA